MTEIFILIGGAVLGAGLAALVLRARQGRALSEALRASDGAAAAAQARVEELRAQAARRDEETARLGRDLACEREERVRAETACAALAESNREQSALIEKTKSEMSNAFSALAASALKSSNEEFLKLADQALAARAQAGARELEGKKALIDGRLDEVGKRLEEMQRKVAEAGEGGLKSMAEVLGQMRRQAEATTRLAETTEGLRRTFASSKKRGEWGERMAEDIIRLTGLIEGVNYIKQKALDHATGIPDYTFFLPGGLKINMDVKFPMDGYAHYLAAESDYDRKRHRDDILRGARTMIRQVITREYINTAENTVDYVIVFIPNEQVYAFLNEADLTLMDDALKQKVILCSPFTLYAVLAVVRQAVENFNLERTASEILALLGDFSKQWGEFKKKMKAMGDRLDQARNEYDALVSTRTNQLERPLRKIEDLRRTRSIELEGGPIEIDAEP